MSFQDVGQRNRRSINKVVTDRSMGGVGGRPDGARMLSESSLHVSPSDLHDKLSNRRRNSRLHSFGDVSFAGSMGTADTTSSSSSSSGNHSRSSSSDVFFRRNSNNRESFRSYGGEEMAPSLGRLSDDVSRFQRVVKDLNYLQTSRVTYGASEIHAKKARVAEELGSSIRAEIQGQWDKLDRLEGRNSGGLRTELTKLQRDFQRVWESYLKVKAMQGRNFAGSDDDMSDRFDRGPSTKSWDGEQEQIVAQREEEYALHVMREREEEMMKINSKVHQVNEIYKDLGHIVQSQQEDIDKLEENIDVAKDYTHKGLEQLEEANRPSRWRNPFQSHTAGGENDQSAEGGEMEDSGETSADQSSSRWPRKQLDSVREDMNEIHKDITSMITDIVRRGKFMMLGCTAMGDISTSPVL